MKKRGVAGPTTAATVALERAGVGFIGHPYAHDASVTEYGAEAASALGVDAGRIFKTLVIECDNGLAVAVVPVDGMLDLKALAAACGAKRAALADRALAERRTGYVLGGISPFGQKTAAPTVLDASALVFQTIFVSGGRRGFDVEVSPHDLLRVTGGRTAAIRRG